MKVMLYSKFVLKLNDILLNLKRIELMLKVISNAAFFSIPKSLKRAEW